VRCLVTGAAGFIGSNLVDGLVSRGHHVRGVDSLTDYYDVKRKLSNLTAIEALGVQVVRADLIDCDLQRLLNGVDVVFHLAGQPGVRSSWGEGFPEYLSRNVHTTQRLLEAARQGSVDRLVIASSSSVYGEAPRYPTDESDLPAPISPYGVTKLAVEHLSRAYVHNWQVPTVLLRYFTVYGPRQRPDMAIHRFFQAVRRGEPISLWGTGEQVRDFTFVGDVVTATIAAATSEVPPGTALNIAGGSSLSVNELVALIERTTGTRAVVERLATQPGDVTATGGSIELARRLLGWKPETPIAEGLARQWNWQRALE
jgi:UDP-glucuronate 4-epimerase